MVRKFLISHAIGLGIVVAAAPLAWADPQPGECASGYCGTPKNNGGGGCGCGGGSILVANTDIGETYSKTDDWDGDGIADDFDNCAFVANRSQADSDGDKLGDACDNCAAAANPDQRDTNANGQGDVCDTDIDGDKLANASDNCPAVPNVAQGDTDKDGLGDVCDADMDGDNVPNNADNCPLVANPDQDKSAPGKYGDACDSDADKDNVDDSRDNCMVVFNDTQVDTDSDKIGDACDLDIDGDTLQNKEDNCPLVGNVDQKDADRDGVGDMCQLSGFCFVAGKNRAAKCLDPKSVFQVTAAPRVEAKTGEDVFPSIYANRERATIQYSWIVVSQPQGANVTVRNPVGTVAESEMYEYRYAQRDRRPVFTATHPGKYTVRLVADLVGNDPLFPAANHAESEVELDVTGAVTAAGCSVGRGGGSADPMGGALLLVLGALVLVRRRARR